MRNLLAHETAGAARTRHSLRPLSSREGQRIRKTSGNHVARTGTHVSSSLRANGSRECAPDDRLREAIHLSACRAMDCFVASAPRKDRKRAARIPPHRHCEPTGRAYARPMTGSAKQSSFAAAKKGQIVSAFALTRFGGLPPGVACAASEEGSSQALLARAVAITAFLALASAFWFRRTWTRTYSLEMKAQRPSVERLRISILGKS
jgi:hypothetical protein